MPNDAPKPESAPGAPAVMTATAPSVINAASDAANVVVKCAGVTKKFKDFWLRDRVTAVDDLNLEIRRGEVFGLLGPNGSGKSTTIKMILGLLNPTAGRIAVLGRPPSDVGIKKRIGYLPEESYLYRFLSPTETLDYYGRLFKQDRIQRAKRTETLLEMVGLTHAARRPVGEFSKGMQRKVGLAQALINDPDLLILDEPTSGMDPIATAEVKVVIQRLKERGKTVLLCSHLLADVQDVCDRVVIMYGGKIREQGNLGELLTIQGRTQFETDSLPEAAITEIEQVLQRHGHSILSSRSPTKNLDELFLEIVDKARSEGVRTAGAVGGGVIADFLNTDGPDDAPMDAEAAQAAVLGDLTRAETPEVATESGANGGSGDPTGSSPSDIASASSAASGTTDSNDTASNDALLDLLAQNQPDTAAEATAAAAQSGNPAPMEVEPDADVDSNVLDALLGDVSPEDDASRPNA